MKKKQKGLDRPHDLTFEIAQLDSADKTPYTQGRSNQALTGNSDQNNQNYGQKIHKELKKSSFFWDYHLIYWVFCLIFAFKDDSICLEETMLGPALSFKTFLIVEGFTTLYCPIIYISAKILSQNFDNTCLEEKIKFFLAPFYLFKFVWTILFMQVFFFILDMTKCSQLVIEFFVAYNIGLFFVFREVCKVCNQQQNSQFKERLQIQQQKYAQSLRRMNFSTFYQQVSEKFYERRVIYAFSTYFGLYLAINDNSQALNEDPQHLKNWMILQFCTQIIVPILLIIDGTFKGMRYVYYRLFTNEQYQKGYGCASLYMEKKSQSWYGIRDFYMAWDLINIIIVFVGFIITLTYPLADFNDVVIQYLALNILLRVVYYCQYILLRKELSPPSHDDFNDEFYELIIKQNSSHTSGRNRK